MAIDLDKNADDTLLTDEHRVERNGAKIVFFTPKGKKPLGEKQYGTAHAAVCAMGRCRADHSFADTILANIQINELKGRKVSGGGQRRRGVVKMDYIALLALQRLATKKKPLEAITEEILQEVRDRVENEEGFEGVGTLRSQMAELNSSLSR